MSGLEKVCLALIWVATIVAVGSLAVIVVKIWTDLL